MLLTSPTLRAGAGGLCLLVLLHASSALLHSCCLGEGGQAGEGGMHAGHVVAAQESSGGHGDHTRSMDVMGVSDGLVAPVEGGHSQHGSDAPSDDCGVCGFCCETTGEAALVGQPAGPTAEALPPLVTLASIDPSVPLTAPAFLLPYANAPPLV